MNQMQKERISELRSSGMGYKKIAELLGISINTVKSYCKRSNLCVVTQHGSDLYQTPYCPTCRSSVSQTPGKKAKKFCSDKCRLTWWNEHPEAINHKISRYFICVTCGNEFEGYGKRERKYCSRACYGKSKMVHHE